MVTHQAGRPASRPLAAAAHAPSMEGVASARGVQRPKTLEYQIYPPSSSIIWYSSNWNGVGERLSKGFSFSALTHPAWPVGDGWEEAPAYTSSCVHWIAWQIDNEIPLRSDKVGRKGNLFVHPCVHKHVIFNCLHFSSLHGKNTLKSIMRIILTLLL